MTWYQRICPHIFGWSYNTHRQIRFCRGCAKPQHRTEDGNYADMAPSDPPR